MSTTAYTETHAINIPEVEIREDKPYYSYSAIRGYGYHLAVHMMLSKTCVGWIDTRVLGYNDAADWLQDQV